MSCSSSRPAQPATIPICAPLCRKPWWTWCSFGDRIGGTCRQNWTWKESHFKLLCKLLQTMESKNIQTMVKALWLCLLHIIFKLVRKLQRAREVQVSTVLNFCSVWQAELWISHHLILCPNTHTLWSPTRWYAILENTIKCSNLKLFFPESVLVRQSNSCRPCFMLFLRYLSP